MNVAGVDALIEKRAAAKNAANQEVEREKAQDRRRLEALKTQNRTLWIHHHGRMAEEFARLSAHHERRARRLLGEVGP